MPEYKYKGIYFFALNGKLYWISIVLQVLLSYFCIYLNVNRRQKL